MSDSQTSDKSNAENSVEENSEKTEEKAYTVRYENPCCVVIEGEAEADALKEDYQEQLETYQENAQLPGFRRGKAPSVLIERRFGDSLKEQVLQSAASEIFREAVNDEDITVVKELDIPEFENFDWEPGQPAKFEFKCEVIPSLDPEEEQYKGLTIEAPSKEIPEELFESALKQFAQRFAEWEKLGEDAAIDREDSIRAGVKVLKPELETNLAEEDFYFQPTRGQMGPFEVEGLQGAMEGTKVGDSIEVEATFNKPPADDDLGPELAELEDSDNVTLELCVKEAYRQKVPEIDDELASRLGLESGDEIRDLVRSQVEQDVAQKRDSVMRDRLLDRLAEQVDIELPDSLVEQTAREQKQRALRRLWQNGRNLEEAKEEVEKDGAFEEKAEKMLKLELMLQKIAEKERIYVSESEVEEQIKIIADRQGQDTLRTRRMLEKEDMLDSLRSDMRKEKVIADLLENAEINEVEWNNDDGNK